MSREDLRWNTLQALKNSPKGKIVFDPRWWEKGADILAGSKDAPCLSSSCGLILEHLSPLSLGSSCFLSSGSGDLSPAFPKEFSAPASSTGSFSCSDGNARRNAVNGSCRLRVESEQAPCDEEKVEDAEVSRPASPPSISLLSPSATQVAGQIIKFEQEYRLKAKMALKLWQEIQEKKMVTVASSGSEQLKRFEEFMELKRRQEHQSMRDMMDRETKESIGRQEKLKEEQRHRNKILNLRLREAEQQRMREAELERQRQAEGRERVRNLNAIQEEILQLNQLLDPSTQNKADLPLASLGSLSTRGNQLCTQVSEVVRKTAEGEFPSVDDMTVAERALHDMKDLIHLMQEEFVKAQEERKKEQNQEEERRKQVELQKQQEALKKAVQSSKDKAQRKGLQNSAEDATLKWCKELQDSTARCVQAFEQLDNPKDAQTKKQKLEFRKIATIPVCQISCNSGSQLRKIFDKIDKLLSGQEVLSGGKSVSTSQHPQGLGFVSYALAEKFVKQGEEEVASHHEAVFPIAAVASGIWELHPQVGDFFLAHLHKKCPYAIPHYPPMKEGTSVEEYQRILGYRVDGSGVEGQDSFLKRMSGMIRLYAAVIQQRWPHGSKQGAAPHGLNHGWRWLAQMLNMAPLADITATVLLDFLEVCGNALVREYQGQFWKLLLLLQEEYLQRIEEVTSSHQLGSLCRLRQFLENSLRSRQISPPKGQLSSMFWKS
ncbi:mRNA export factor GLE1 isoform X2 [Brachionichthys hirsutus]|uniref:mRNA export factor GLE1 isoform X2 n=1 Tax=Brachionichthys hirsutus TaxID=412623 RepID=UPI0036044CEC